MLPVSIAPRNSARADSGRPSSSGAKVACRSSRKRASAAATARRTAGDVGARHDQGATDVGVLLEECGPVRHGALDAGRQREPGGELGHVGPLAAQLQRRHELVEVVHVGEVVEDEAERDAGAPGHGFGRRVRVAGAQQLHQGLGDVAPGPLSPGDPPVPGRLLKRNEGGKVEGCLVGVVVGFGDILTPQRLSRSAGRPSGACGHWCPLPLPVTRRIQRALETCVAVERSTDTPAHPERRVDAAEPFPDRRFRAPGRR